MFTNSDGWLHISSPIAGKVSYKIPEKVLTRFILVERIVCSPCSAVELWPPHEADLSEISAVPSH